MERSAATWQSMQTKAMDRHGLRPRDDEGQWRCDDQGGGVAMTVGI